MSLLFLAQVEVSCSARVPSSSGRQGEGVPFYETQPGRPLRFTIGARSVGRHFEQAVCTLAKGERAIVSCPIDHTIPDDSTAVDTCTVGSMSPPPPPAGIGRVEYELELLAMLQVGAFAG